MVDAQWLFLMTDVDSLYTSNPRTDPDAKPIHVVENIDKLKEMGTQATSISVLLILPKQQ